MQISPLPAPLVHQNFKYLFIDLRDKANSNILSCIPASNLFIEAGVKSGGIFVHWSVRNFPAQTLPHAYRVCIYIDNMDFGGYARTFRICHFNIFDACPYSKNPNNNNNKKNFAETQSPCSRGGKSRSPALVIAYLMASLRWSFKKSHTHMMERRPAIEVGLCTQCNFFVLLSFLFSFCVVFWKVVKYAVA